jgi:hypothetical protein
MKSSVSEIPQLVHRRIDNILPVTYIFLYIDMEKDEYTLRFNWRYRHYPLSA